MTRYAFFASAILMVAATAHGGEKKLMHCFAWTPVKEATQADWQAFHKASDELPKQIKGVTKVWYGKLVSPVTQYATVQPDADTTKKLRAGDTVTTQMKRTPREYGMCMEMENEAARKAYGEHPYHKVWTEAYAKVRVEGTTTFDIIGQ